MSDVGPDKSWRPVPDPTTLTTEQLLREIAGVRSHMDAQIETLEERLRGMDRATELRLLGITDIPKQIDTSVSHLKELMDTLFSSVALQFDERDKRGERESRDNKLAVDAAFAAQEKAAIAQNESNTLAIDKSEKATTETLTKQADLFKSTTDALAGKIEDLKDNVMREIADIKRSLSGAKGGVDSRQQSIAYLIAAAGIAIALVSLVIRAVG